MAAEIKTVASLDNSRFLAGLNGMSAGMGSLLGRIAGLNGMSAGMGSLLGRIAGLAAGFVGIRSVVTGFSQAIDLGGKMTDISARTGIAVKDLFVLQQAFGQVGSSAELVVPSVQKMQQVLSGLSRTGKIGREILQQLGLNPDELRKLGAKEQFSAIATAIGSIADPAQQTAAAIELFGESGPQLKELFSNPDIIRRTAAALGELPDQLDKSAARFDELQDRMSLLRVRAQGVFVGAMEGLAPVMSQMVAFLERIDFSRIGKGIGDAIGIIVELFASGSITEAARLALAIGFAKAVNTLASTIGSFTWWKGVVNIAIGAFTKLGAVLIRIFSEPLAYLEAGITWVLERLFQTMGKIPGIGKAMGLDNFKARSFDENLADARQTGIFSVNQADAADAAAKPFLAEGMRLMREAMANPKNVIDSAEWQRQLSDILDKARQAAQARAEATAPETPSMAPGRSVDINFEQPQKAGRFEAISDAYARIGGLIGGGGVSGLDFNRRTATATERAVNLLQTISGKLEPEPKHPAIWG